MVFKSVSCWSAPREEDLAEFERYYTDVHVPHATRIPGAIRLVLTRLTYGLEGNPSSFYRVAELYFESKDDLLKATTTPEWAEMRADGIKIHERFGVTLESGWGIPEESTMNPRSPRPELG